MASACVAQCPDPEAPDHMFQCSALNHAHHEAYFEWQEALVLHASLQWNIFFLCTCLLLGANFRRILPEQVPYTVGILIIYIIFGVIAGASERQNHCPHHAWAYDANHDKQITRPEWDAFIGVGFNQQSFCVVGGSSGYRREGGRRVCGDGQPDGGSDCKETFESLDSTFKLSSMLAATANKHGANDGVLSADELWTTDCNLFRDMLGLSDIDPHALLVIFLPALLFESAAFGVDMGIFKKQLPQIVTMAFPAMIVASVLTGLLVYAMFDGQWTFWVCWLIGAIVSATDPVAVVALLKDLGASKTLGTMIEGESLLNDGSAIVLYSWIRNVIGYDYATLGPSWQEPDTAHNRYNGQIWIDLTVVVAQMLLFGIVMGFTFGAATRFFLKFIYNDRFIEGTLLICMSYMCFWVGELICGTSAVIAVVVMGLYMNEHKSCLSPAVLHYMHQFYEMIAHILNTTIFAIAGSKLGTLFMHGTFSSLHQIFSWRLWMIYPIVLLTRALAIAMFFPLLKRLGTGCTWQEAVIMWWGGLRGSVGLALGLVVFHTSYDANQWGSSSFEETGTDGRSYTSLDCRDQPHVVLFMNMVVVLLTVVINGITMAPLMRYLKMIEIPLDRRFQLNTGYLQLRDKTENFIAKLKREAANEHDHPYAKIDWTFVRHQMVRHEDLFTFEKDEDVKRAAWMAVLTIERASYLAQFESGSLSAEAFLYLEQFMATLVADASKTPTDELSKVYDDEMKVFVDKLRNTSLLTAVGHRKLIFECCVAYHTGQHEVEHALVSTFEETEDAQALQEGNYKAQERDDEASESSLATAQDHAKQNAMQRAIMRKMAREQLDEVRKDHVDNIQMMEELNAEFERKYNSIKQQSQTALFKANHALNRVLLKQQDTIEHMRHEGILSDLDAAPLHAECEHKLRKIKLEELKEMMSFRRSSAYAKVIIDPRRITKIMDNMAEGARLTTVCYKTNRVAPDPGAGTQAALEPEAEPSSSMLYTPVPGASPSSRLPPLKNVPSTPS